MDKRLNSPSSHNPYSSGLNTAKLTTGPTAGNNIKKTIDILRQRLSISPNRAMETIQRINVTQPLANSQSDIYRDSLTKAMKFDKERGSLTSNSQTGDLSQFLPGQAAYLRTDRSYKKYGFGNTPPRSKDSSRNKTKKISNPISSKHTFPSTKTGKMADMSGQSGESSRILDKSIAGSTKKLSHNIYMPKQTKKKQPGDTMLKKVNMEVSRGGSKNRSSTPNARDTVKSRLATTAADEKPRTDSSLNLGSASGIKGPVSGSSIMSRLKLEAGGPVGEKRNSNLGVRR